MLLSACTMFIEPDDLAHSVFEAFKMNDVEAALEFTLDSEDYEDLFSNYTLDESEKKRLIDKHNQTYVKKLQERFRKRFRAIIDDGAKKEAGRTLSLNPEKDRIKTSHFMELRRVKFMSFFPIKNVISD